MSLYRNVVWFTKGIREYTKSGFESASARFDPKELEGVRLDNRRVMVTGANSGIGLACCKELIKRGAEIHMVCLNMERGQAARDAIIEAAGNPNATVHLHQLNLAKAKSVFEFARQFSTTHDRLDVLINNAGCMANELSVDANSLEVNFATNTLATYILTETLLPILKKSTDPRVIVVSSGGMLVQKLDHADPMLVNQRNSFDGTMVYAQNKRQQVVMTEIWAESHPDIQFASMHPGWADTPAVANSMPDFHHRMHGRLRTPEQGADTVVWLALTPNLRKYPNGSFFQDRKVVPKHLPLARTHSSHNEKLQFIDKLAEIAKPFMT